MGVGRLMTHPPLRPRPGDKPQNTDRWACCVSRQNKEKSRRGWKPVENKSTADSLSKRTSENFKRLINSETLQTIQSKHKEWVVLLRSDQQQEKKKILGDDAGRIDDWCSARPDAVYDYSILNDTREPTWVWDDPQCNPVGLYELTSRSEIHTVTVGDSHMSYTFITRLLQS